MDRLGCPGADALVERARAAAVDAPLESREAFARLELDLIRDEATRTLALATLLPRGMARIALATGTAFAVLCLARYERDGLLAATLGAVLSFGAGGLSASTAAWFGRRARDRAASSAVEWKRALATAARTLAKDTH